MIIPVAETFEVGYKGYELNKLVLLPDHTVHNQNISKQSHHAYDGVQRGDAHSDSDRTAASHRLRLAALAPVGQKSRWFLHKARVVEN